MSIFDAVSFFTIMTTLAIIPSTSVVFVIARSVSMGVGNGIAGSLGIVTGDIIFIIFAMLGLSMVEESMSALFLSIKYTGGFYLIWLGYTFFKPKQNTVFEDKPRVKSNYIVSYFAGIFLTLGDLKASLFYVSMFSAFVDLESLKLSDIFIILIVTVLTVGSVKITYVLLARKIINQSKGLKFELRAKKFAGFLLIGVGGYIIINTLITHAT